MSALEKLLSGRPGLTFLGGAPEGVDAGPLWQWMARMSTEPVRVVSDADETADLGALLLEVLREAGVPALHGDGHLAVSGVDRGALQGVRFEAATAATTLIGLSDEPSFLLLVPHPEGGHVVVALDTEEWDRRLFARRLP